MCGVCGVSVLCVWCVCVFVVCMWCLCVFWGLESSEGSLTYMSGAWAKMT